MTGRWIVVAAAALVILAGGTWYGRHRGASHVPAAAAAAPDVTVPGGDRIRVEVLNATRTRGLARRATFLLRDRGFDVVMIGTESAQGDSTTVIDRTNHPEWAQRVARALGGARVESHPDSTLYVDVSVFVGRTWRAPAEPLHP